MKKKIIKLLLITTLSTLILTGCKDSEETISNSVESTETTSVIESNEVVENTSDATSETTATSEISETESASAIETSESETTSEIETSESESDFSTETTTEPVSTSTTESTEENTTEENSSNDSTEVATTQGTVIITSSEFIIILNAKRAELGLSLVSTDANLDALAAEDAKLLKDDYAHHGVGNTGNIAKGMGDSSPQRVFDAWWNSEGHRAVMLDPYLTHVATAYYSDGGYYTLIGLRDTDAYHKDLAEQLNQGTSTPSAPTETVNTTDVGNGQTVEVTGTPGAVEVVPPDEAQDLKDQWGW